MAEINETLDAMVAMRSLADAGERHRSVTLRIPESTYHYLQRIADRESGGNVSELMRTALGAWLKEYHKRRQAELRRLGDLVPELAEQARELFRQLPTEEIKDDELLEFTANAAGELTIRLPDDRHYSLFEGHAVRLALVAPDCGEMTLWRDGVEVERRQFTLSAMAEWTEARASTGLSAPPWSETIDVQHDPSAQT